MKNCEFCGFEIEDKDYYCPYCGMPNAYRYDKNEDHSYHIYLFMIKICLIGGILFYTLLGLLIDFILLIPLIWTIPMTIKYFRYREMNKKIPFMFKLCMFLFSNAFAGLLLIACSEE